MAKNRPFFSISPPTAYLGFPATMACKRKGQKRNAAEEKRAHKRAAPITAEEKSITAEDFVSEEAKQRYEKHYSKFKVVTERRAVVEGLSDFGIKETTQRLNWETLFDVQYNDMYGEPVKLFYSNLTIPDPEEQGFVSNVFGHSLNISPGYIAQLLKLTGPADPRAFPPPSYSKLKRMIVTEKICGHKVVWHNTLERKFLLPKYSILSMMILNNLVPKGGHMNDAGADVVYILWCIAKGYVLDPALIIWKVMVNVTSGRRMGGRSLPFRGLVCLICKDCGVVFRANCVPVYPLLPISATTVLKMGFDETTNKGKAVQSQAEASSFFKGPKVSMATISVQIEVISQGLQRMEAYMRKKDSEYPGEEEEEDEENDRTPEDTY